MHNTNLSHSDHPTSHAKGEYIKKQVQAVREYSPLACEVGWSEWDRFVLCIPYCGRILKWDVLYNIMYLTYPPDFILPEDEDMFQYNNLRTIQTYDHTKPDALLQIVLEIFELYKDHQKARIRCHPNERIQFEYSTLEHDKGIEFLLDSTEQQSEIRFLFPLGIDLVRELGYDGLEYDVPDFNPDLPTKVAPSGNVSMLAILKPDTIVSKGPDIRINIPIWWDRVFARFPIKYPQWTSSSCLMEYTQHIHAVIMSCVNMLKLRKAFFSSLINLFGNPLEYDSVHLAKISFFFQEVGGAITCIF
jgi:hypothetical protein